MYRNFLYLTITSMKFTIYIILNEDTMNNSVKGNNILLILFNIHTNQSMKARKVN